MKIYDNGHNAMVVGPVYTTNAVQTMDEDRWAAGVRKPDGYHMVYGTKEEVLGWMKQVAATGDVTTGLEYDVVT